MKKIRLTAFILSLASCLFLFSAGFSTWFKVVLPTDIDPATGEFTAYSVVDVISNGSTLNLNVDNFQYTSFKFVNGDSGTISIEYDFNSTSDVNVTLSYENLSGYADVSSFPGLFNQIIENSNNYIKIDLTNATFSDGSSSVTIKKESNTNLIPSQANPDTTKEGKIDEIAFTITPTSAETNVTITYTFHIPTGEGLEGNFRQNLGKYLKAFKDTEGNYTDVTKFISTVVASSSAS